MRDKNAHLTDIDFIELSPMKNSGTRFNSKALEFVIEGTTQNKGAEFTVRSKKTQTDYTYKIKRSEFQGRMFTHVYVEKEYQNYQHIGCYFNGQISKKKELVQTPAAVAIAWVLRKVEERKFDLLAASVDLYHLGSCIRCGRTLTDATSIEIGLGPVCRNK